MEHDAGIDVSLDQSSVCVIEAKALSEPETLVAFFGQLGVPLTRIRLEAEPLSQWLHAGLTAAGFEAALSARVVKTDRKDVWRATREVDQPQVADQAETPLPAAVPAAGEKDAETEPLATSDPRPASTGRETDPVAVASADGRDPSQQPAPEADTPVSTPCPRSRAWLQPR